MVVCCHRLGAACAALVACWFQAVHVPILSYQHELVRRILGAAAMANTVMAMGGKERTETMLRDILDKSGLELVKMWRPDVGVQGLIEAKLKG